MLPHLFCLDDRACGKSLVRDLCRDAGLALDSDSERTAWDDAVKGYRVPRMDTHLDLVWGFKRGRSFPRG